MSREQAVESFTDDTELSSSLRNEALSLTIVSYVALSKNEVLHELDLLLMLLAGERADVDFYTPSMAFVSDSSDEAVLDSEIYNER